MRINKDVQTMIERELEPYPISYNIDAHSTTTCYLDMVSGDGCKERVGFSPNAYGNTILNIRSDIRKKLRRMDVHPIPERRRQARISGLGEKILEAADAIAPAREIDIDTTPKPIEVPVASVSPETPMKEAKMSTPTNVLQINGHKADTEKTSDKPGFAKLIQREIVQTTQLILANSDVDFNTKTIVYKTGWSDERIAQILATAPGREGIGVNHVKYLRKESFGLTPDEQETKRRREKTSMSDEDRAWMKNLEARIQALEDAATRP